MSAERRRVIRRRLAERCALVCLLSLVAEDAVAQPAAPPAKAQVKSSLRSRLGVEAAAPLLRSESTDLRLRGFEKLGATGTSAALELLADALEAGGAARTANERLTAVRALARHALEERARGALVRAMGGALTRDEPGEIMVRQTAALALARSGDKNALQALGQALRQPGRVSETARIALRAHPPKAIEPLLLARGVPTPALAGLFGDLGYQRGRELLSTLSQSGAPALRAEAMLALAKIDRATAVGLAKSFYKNEKHRSLRLAAARVLATARDQDAAAALGTLLAEPALVGDAIAIALDAPSPALAPLLARITPSDPGDGERLLAALGRAGGRASLDRLERTLGHAELGWASAYALALSPDGGAEDVLERALDRPTTRRSAARAAVLRLRARGSEVDGLDDALGALEGSTNAADRAVAAFCRAASEPDAGVRLVLGRDPVIVRAAARAALDPEVSLAAARRLAVEPDPLLRTALAVSLVRPEAADLVPTSVLTALFEARGAAAHLAAFALAARDGDAERPRLRELLGSGDPLLRAHVALGLARSKEPSAVGLLDDAYRFESDPSVRRAIVTALAQRAEPGRERTLRLAADLDPDDKARTHARRALGRGRPGPAAPDPATGGTGTAWIRLDGAPNDKGSVAVVVTSAGLALPLGPDPDGHVLFAGLPGGPVSVTLASAAPGGESSRAESK
jgi:cellulose synthase operon protein C